MTLAWTAPAALGPIDALVLVPGSKSQSARALYLAAVAQGPSLLRGVLDSRDTRLFTAALAALGATATPRAGAVIEMSPMTPGARSGGDIDCGLAGTVMRFLPPLAALSSAPTRFDGDDAARLRPLAPLLDALTALGASISFEGRAGSLPFTIRGPLRVPASGEIEIDASASSQFLSALLLVAPLLDAPLRIVPRGPLVSLPHIDMTVEALRRRGCRIGTEGPSQAPRAWRVDPGAPSALDETIEADLSNAGPFLAAAMATGGRVRIPGWPEATTQAGDAWRDILTRMGGRVSRDGEDLVLEGPEGGRIRGIDLDMSSIGELAPTLAALAALADSPSRLRGIAHLRGHETDRLAALATGLRAAGIGVEEHEDGLSIRPGELRAADHRAWGDHRMATFAAILGLRAPGTTLDDIGATSKTLPGFSDMWREMLATAPRGARA